MRRGKPQQEIYRPGSGPLRKSTPGLDEPDDTRQPYDDPKFRNFHTQNKGGRKPEQPLYVPRPVVNARETYQESQHVNGNFENRSKRYSNRRRNTSETGTEWRDNSRQLRQGSEPRTMRDTRSVEPITQPIRPPYQENKYKPPSGRRHSTIGMEGDNKRPLHKTITNIDKLPPRFRKKILEESKLVDDNWNGASLTFQGSGNSQQGPAFGYYTLPNRGRGRARSYQDYDTNYRSRTPEVGGFTSPCNSRPPTPPPSRAKPNENRTERPRNDEYRPNDFDFRRNRDRNSRRGGYNQTRGSRDDRKNQNYETVHQENWDVELKKADNNEPPVVEIEETAKDDAEDEANTTIFDWSEEVEMNDRLEQEAFSDALTRSSSVASLVDASLKSPISNAAPPKKHKKRSGRNKRRSNSRRRDAETPERRPSDAFKVPEPRGHHNQRRDASFERRPKSRPQSREPSFDRNRRESQDTTVNWREEIIRSRQNSERDETHQINVKKPGVIVLPTAKTEPPKHDQPRYPEMRKPSQQKSLFDHNNPSKPIIVKSPGSRVSVPGFSDNKEPTSIPIYTTDQFGNIRPHWYDEQSEGYKSCHYPSLIDDIKRADKELTYIIDSGQILINWGTVDALRNFLKEALQYLLCKDLKFCQRENVEQHLWKILYHSIIEMIRKAITNDPANKEQYKGFVLYLINEGTGYLEGLLESLEENYQFKLNNYLGNSMKSSGYIGLALVSAQKLFLFLGDLGRYKEQVCETSNYGKCRQWYVKAHEINPKNGKPYNQLAVLAVYARRKLDAVYYYMRSLMSSNPVPSARECLVTLFDENSKKYEQGERKRREERLERAKQHMKQKESENLEKTAGSLRHETWIRPNGGRRVHRTTQSIQEEKDSEEEDLAVLSSVEVNKRFVISYLHVHGKLITRIGMESFQEAAMQMLKEFRALLQHSPVPLPCNRFLQLLALNMFAIDSTQLKDPDLQSQAGYRSEVQERALVVSLQMFNLILERCVSLLQENHVTNVADLPPDVHVLLPAVKIWCDWMLCHSSVWNPPPSTQDFRVGTASDVWSRIAILMNILEKLDQNPIEALISQPIEGFEVVKLPEDHVLSGFTPLMVNEPDVKFAPTEMDPELGQFALRINKLLFFGTVFLCGLEPPVLKLEIEDDFREYVSVVCTSNSRDSPIGHQSLNNEVLMESFSEDDEAEETRGNFVADEKDETSSEVKELLSRKVELERTQRRQQLHKERVKKILSQAVVSVHLEVRPKYLVPDTNCFIDHLDRIMKIAASHVYTLKVPIVVMSELEGLSRGGKSPIPTARSFLDPEHVKKVAEAATRALQYLKSKPAAVKCVTTKGAVLPSTAFTTEDDSTLDASFKNDDKILATCLVLNKGHQNHNNNVKEVEEDTKAGDEPKRVVSEVVLLTDDRNLRVKALARDVPVRELMDFIQWAGLG